MVKYCRRRYHAGFEYCKSCPSMQVKMIWRLLTLQKLADAHINGTKDGGEGNGAFILPYQWLMLHYKDAGDEANMMKYANLGKEAFP